jgi:HEAT repeats
MRGHEPGRGTAGRSLGATALAAALAAVLLLAGVARAAPQVKVEDLCKALIEDPNYKVRVQAALVLGRLGDKAALPALVKALEDANKTVRAISAQALGQLADHQAADPLRELLKREGDPFVRTQTEKALALVSVDAGGNGSGKKAKIYLNFGSFTGGTKAANAEAAKIIHDALARELGKLPVVTLSLAPADQKVFPKSGLLGFYIDGNITRLDDVPAGGSSETSCDVKVMVARWPSKSIILWTNAGASLQSGTRPQDKVGARKDCLEASAGQLAEDLGKFFKGQGG